MPVPLTTALLFAALVLILANEQAADIVGFVALGAAVLNQALVTYADVTAATAKPPEQDNVIG